jgi:hypothetical protein
MCTVYGENTCAWIVFGKKTVSETEFMYEEELQKGKVEVDLSQPYEKYRILRSIKRNLNPMLHSLDLFCTQDFLCSMYFPLIL